MTHSSHASLPVSLVVITLNEESNLKRCINSAKFCSDILVVDSFSKDRTVEVAESCGARVIQKEWLGYGAQKAFAVEKAKFDWILSLDADEALSPELQDELLQKFKQGLSAQVGYEFSRRSFHLGRWILHGGWFPDWQLRFFNRLHSSWKTSAIHEKVESPEIQRFKNPVLHWVFDDLSDQVLTNNKYSTLQAEDILKKNKSRVFLLFKLLVKPPVKFIECYFLKLGFMDGLPGFIIAVGASYSVFLKWAKVIERQLQWPKK